MGLTLFAGHEVNDLLARVHPSLSKVGSSKLALHQLLRSDYSHMPPYSYICMLRSDILCFRYWVSLQYEGAAGRVTTIVSLDGYMRGTGFLPS